MFRVGLTGGIAAGKSVVSRRLGALGAHVVDHDVLAREAVRPGTVALERLAEHFGDEILLPDGSLDRAALGHLVFGDHQELAFLNGVIHPEVHRLSVERDAAIAASDGTAVIVHDIPLLVETGQADSFDLVVVVHAPADQRIQRLVEARSLPLPEARRRVAAQADDEARLAAADVVLDGTGREDGLVEQVDRLWERLAAEARAEDDVSQGRRTVEP